MPGTSQVLNIRYHVSYFQKSEKTRPRITKQDMRKQLTWNLVVFSFLWGRAESREDRARKRHDERKPVWHLCENYKKVPLLQSRRGPTCLGEPSVGWGPAATNSPRLRTITVSSWSPETILGNVGREAIECILVLDPKCPSSSHGQATHWSSNLCLH